MTDTSGPSLDAAHQLHTAMQTLGSLPVHADLVAEDVRVRLRTASDWPARALTDEFTPYLSAVTRRRDTEDDGPAEELRVMVDAGLADRVRTAANQLPYGDLPEGYPEQSHASIDGVHLVRKVVRKITGRPGARADAHLLWNENEPAVSYIVLPDRSPPSRRLLLRMVRAIIGRILLAAGWMPLHAACAVTDAGAVCLTGGRGRGKTTALLHLLGEDRRAASFLANDKVFVAVRSGGVVVRGLPTAIGIRPPTVRMFPQLRELAGQSGALHFENTPDPTVRHDDPDPRMLVTPRQLADTFASSLVPTAALVALIGVDYRGEGSNPRQIPGWESLPPAAALALWRSAYLTEWLLYDEYELTRMTASASALRHDHQRLAQRLARTVPGAIFRPGPEPGRELYRGVDELLG